MNLLLCGLPKSGKTTIGKCLAKKLGCRFVDTDVLIEESFREESGYALNCRQIYLQCGESAFRRLEKQQIMHLKNHQEQTVIALGGGSLGDHLCQKQICSLGSLIYLKYSPINLFNRVNENGIPAYLEGQDPLAEFCIIANRRMRIFESLANVVIEAQGLSVESTAALILENLYNK